MLVQGTSQKNATASVDVVFFDDFLLVGRKNAAVEKVESTSHNVRTKAS